MNFRAVIFPSPLNPLSLATVSRGERKPPLRPPPGEGAGG